MNQPEREALLTIETHARAIRTAIRNWVDKYGDGTIGAQASEVLRVFDKVLDHLDDVRGNVVINTKGGGQA